MSSRYERQIRNLNLRDLYPRRKRTPNSASGSTESVLMSSMSATEALLASAQLPHQQQQQQSATYVALSTNNSSNTNSSTNLNGYNCSNNNNISHLKPNGMNERVHRTPSPTRILLRDPSQNNILPPNPTGPLNGDCGKSAVIVNLNLTGSNFSDKRRLSRILREVHELRELRERADSFDAEMSLEANELNDNEFHYERVGVKRSRNLMLKFRLYDFLKRPASFAATVYHMVAFMLVASCLVLSISPDIEHQIGKMPVLEVLEKTVLFWFTAEFILRLWSAECRPQYKGLRGKIAFLKSPAHLIDLMVIVLSAGLPSISSHDGHEVFAFRAFRGFHRFFQVLQVIALKRQLRPWSLFWSVLYDQREQLLIIFYLEIVFLCLLSYIVFMVEHEANKEMDNITDAMWWSVVTLTTVGYGDKVPVTWTGKLIACVFILFGVAVFALPAGIIGAGLALKLEEVERSRQRRKKKDAAANLIQKAWHCYRANNEYSQLGAFFRHQPGDIFKCRVYNHIIKAFIATARFHLAKNNFREMTRPVDLRNVIESYKYGQMDIFNRIKQLNTVLDLVVSRLTLAEQERVNTMNLLLKHFEQESEIRNFQQNFQAFRIPKHGVFVRSEDTQPTSLFHIPLSRSGSKHPNSEDMYRARTDSTLTHHFHRVSTPNSHNHSYAAFGDSHHTITTINEMSVDDEEQDMFRPSTGLGHHSPDLRHRCRRHSR